MSADEHEGVPFVCPGPPTCGPHRLDQINPHSSARLARGRRRRELQERSAALKRQMGTQEPAG